MSKQEAGNELAALGTEIRERLTALEGALTKELGDGLVSIVVYGSAARGGYRAGQSDVDLVLVVREASRETLLAIANVMQVARYAARIEAMILVEGEIAASTDAFPVLYDDIRRNHIVVRGADPFADLVISDRHRRLRVEQELREARIRLRRAVVDGLGRKEALAGAVIRKAKQIRSPLYALFQLRGVACEDRTHVLLEKAGELYGVDTSMILKATEAPEKAHDALVKLLDAAIAEVDGMDGRMEGP
ncbi:MAG TPA: nucleotidyltransferase domain-containing protein [Polyangiaceae bacterium]|jgi:predicted nucleotidyltransferase